MDSPTVSTAEAGKRTRQAVPHGYATAAGRGVPWAPAGDTMPADPTIPAAHDNSAAFLPEEVQSPDAANRWISY